MLLRECGGFVIKGNGCTWTGCYGNRVCGWGVGSASGRQRDRHIGEGRALHNEPTKIDHCWPLKKQHLCSARHEAGKLSQISIPRPSPAVWQHTGTAATNVVVGVIDAS